MTRGRALITGATAGIGEAFARLLASENYDLVLVARDDERLRRRAEELRAANPSLSLDVEVLRADLTADADIALVEDRLRSEQRPVTALVNNAGFGINKAFTASDRKAEKDLVDVLVITPMLLMHSALPRMIKDNHGIIINVSSVAGWIAAGTYSAAKSYLTVLSESLHTELRGTGVKVSALCPGFTRTEFHQRGRMRMSGLPNFMWLNVDDVVRYSWKRALSGKALSIPGWQYRLLSAVARFSPRPLVRRMGMNVRTRQRQVTK
jgi:uncharacterized protein